MKTQAGRQKPPCPRQGLVQDVRTGVLSALLPAGAMASQGSLDHPSIDDATPLLPRASLLTTWCRKESDASHVGTPIFRLGRQRAEKALAQSVSCCSGVYMYMREKKSRAETHSK